MQQHIIKLARIYRFSCRRAVNVVHRDGVHAVGLYTEFPTVASVTVVVQTEVRNSKSYSFLTISPLYFLSQ